MPEGERERESYPLIFISRFALPWMSYAGVPRRPPDAHRAWDLQVGSAHCFAQLGRSCAVQRLPANENVTGWGVF